MAFFQQLPPQQSIGSMFGQGLSQTLPQKLEQFYSQKKQKKELEEFLNSDYVQSLDEKDQSLMAGLAKGLIPPQALAAFKTNLDPEVEAENVEIMKDAFGERFSKIWKAAGQGERTALTNAALDAKFRGQDIQELLGEKRVEIPQKDQKPEVIEDSTSLYETPNEEEVQVKLEEFPSYELNKANMTPKDFHKFTQDLRKENSPLYTEASDRTKTSKKELSSLQNLEKLNETRKLPETPLEQIGQAINPLSGRLVFPSLSSPETQAFDKTIQDFTTKAKESFGARVTNFELQQFLRRLPRLVNSYEGRKIITEQMRLITQMDNLYAQSLKDVFEHYGLDGIKPEDAKRIAEARIAPQINKLEKQYNRVDERINEFTKNKKTKPTSTKEFTHSKLPSPRDVRKNAIMEDEKGNRFRNTGKAWRKL